MFSRKLKDWSMLSKALLDLIWCFVKEVLIRVAFLIMFLNLLWLELQIIFGGKEPNVTYQIIEVIFGVVIAYSYILVARRVFDTI